MASKTLPKAKQISIINHFIAQRSAIEGRLPKEKTEHQFSVPFEVPYEGTAYAVYGSWPWEFFWIHYSAGDGSGVHQIEAWKCRYVAEGRPLTR